MKLALALLLIATTAAAQQPEWCKPSKENIDPGLDPRCNPTQQIPGYWTMPDTSLPQYGTYPIHLLPCSKTVNTDCIVVPIGVGVTCDEQYAQTTGNLRDAYYDAIAASDYRTRFPRVMEPLAKAHELVSNMHATNACSATDLAFLRDIDTMLYAHQLATPAEQRAADIQAEQERVKKALSEALAIPGGKN